MLDDAEDIREDERQRIMARIEAIEHEADGRPYWLAEEKELDKLDRMLRLYTEDIL